MTAAADQDGVQSDDFLPPRRESLSGVQMRLPAPWRRAGGARRNGGSATSPGARAWPAMLFGRNHARLVQQPIHGGGHLRIVDVLRSIRGAWPGLRSGLPALDVQLQLGQVPRGGRFAVGSDLLAGLVDQLPTPARRRLRRRSSGGRLRPAECRLATDGRRTASRASDRDRGLGADQHRPAVKLHQVVVRHRLHDQSAARGPAAARRRFGRWRRSAPAAASRACRGARQSTPRHRGCCCPVRGSRSRPSAEYAAADRRPLRAASCRPGRAVARRASGR